MNIVGLATGWRTEQSDTQLLVGFNRAIDRYQVQYVDVPDISFGEARVTSLNRQRTVAAVSSERRFTGGQGALATKLRLYGELHFLPSGERTLDGGYEAGEPLPDDRGWLLGAQLGLWNFARNGHVNLWVRYANGLAAFDELQQPTGLNKERRADGADEVRVAFPAPTRAFGIQFRGYRFSETLTRNEEFDDGHSGRNPPYLLRGPSLRRLKHRFNYDARTG